MCFQICNSFKCFSSNVFLGLAENLKPVNVKIAQLAEALEAVSAEIRYMQNRDKRHRSSKSDTHLVITGL
jgi:hypothetical protein